MSETVTEVGTERYFLAFLAPEPLKEIHEGLNAACRRAFKIDMVCGRFGLHSTVKSPFNADFEQREKLESYITELVESGHFRAADVTFSGIGHRNEPEEAIYMPFCGEGVELTESVLGAVESLGILRGKFDGQDPRFTIAKNKIQERGCIYDLCSGLLCSYRPRLKGMKLSELALFDRGARDPVNTWTLH